MTNNNSNVSEQQEHGSYSSGLIMGFLVGAVGYFLTQTEEGKLMKKKFSGRFHELRNSMIEEGVLSEAEKDITDYIRAARQKISDFLGECGQDLDSSKKTAKKKATKRKKKLFKGI